MAAVNLGSTGATDTPATDAPVTAHLGHKPRPAASAPCAPGAIVPGATPAAQQGPEHVT